MIIKSILNFFLDLKNSKKKKFKNSDKTYQLLRYFYKYSDGLLLYLFSKYLNIKIKKPSDFKECLRSSGSLLREVSSKLYEEILYMRVSNLKIKNEKIKVLIQDNKKNEIDYSYYKNKGLMRLDINSEDLFKNKIVAKIATDKKWIQIIKDILGCEPKLLGIDAWITLPAVEKFEAYDDVGKIVSSQMWHRDCDNLRDIKVMIYLSDVKNEEEGPFEIIKDTNSFKFFNPFQYEMGNTGLRLSDNYVQKKYPKKIISVFAKLGETFIVDTRAIHRGKTIIKKNHHRLMLQLYFSLSSFGKIKENPKLNKNWDSFDVWNEVVKSENYESLF